MPTACSSRRTWAGGSAPPRQAIRGAWIGFSWGHSQAHFCRALLESIAYEYAFYLGILVDQLPGLALVAAARSAAARGAQRGIRSRPTCSICRIKAWGVRSSARGARP